MTGTLIITTQVGLLLVDFDICLGLESSADCLKFMFSVILCFQNHFEYYIQVGLLLVDLDISLCLELSADYLLLFLFQ